VESTPRSAPRLFWRLQIGGWLLIIPFFSVVALVVYQDTRTAVLIGVIRQIIGFGLTLGLWRLYRRWPAETFRFGAHAGKIAAACCLALGADLVLAEGARRLFAIAEPPELAAKGVIVVRLALYVAWSSLYFLIRQEIEQRETLLRLARAEAAHREAELLLLRAQVNPHFLLNALNAIIADAEHAPAAVIRTTYAVADYLRYSLGQQAHRTRLGDELDALGHYLAIEEAHHRGHGLDWKIEADDDARRALAPTALVQPLVENAVKYGIRSSPPPLRLRITATVADGLLRVQVENTGRWLDRPAGGETAGSTGIGLNNVRRRLALLCGDRAALEVTCPAGFVRVEARLPFEPAPAGG